jgi:hypothetical protein
MNTIPIARGFSSGSLRSLYLEMYRGDNLCATGSGFIAYSDWNLDDQTLRIGLATAKHNFTGSNFFTGQFINQSEPYIPNKVKIYFPEINGSQLRFFFVEYDLLNESENDSELFFSLNDADIAFLPIKKEHLKKISSLTFFDISNQDVGEDFFVGSEVQIIGHPVQRFPPNYLAISSFGKLAYEPSFLFPYKVRDDDRRLLNAYLINARTFSGQSGSLVYRYASCHPFLNDSGSFVSNAGARECLIGLYSSRLNPFERKSEKIPDPDLGLVWRTSALLDVLKLLPIMDMSND